MINLFGKNKKKTPVTPKEVVKQLEELGEKYQELSKELADFKQKMQKAVTKVGLIRFNPFKETGGDQSFVIALLNEDNSGFVITSHYFQDHNRVYAKPITEGKSEYPLSREEQEAISKAINPSGKVQISR